MPIDLTGNPLRPAPPRPKRQVKPFQERASFQVEMSNLNMFLEYGYANGPIDTTCRNDYYYDN